MDVITDLSDIPQRITCTGTEYYCFSSLSESEDLVFISLINANNYYSGFIRIQTTAVLILILATILGILVSFFMTRYQYKPVQQVVQVSRAITPQDIYQSTDDELKQIEYAINFIHKQEKQSKKTLSDHSELYQK